VITYAAITFAVIVIVTLGMALYGWHRHLRNDEDLPAPPLSSPETTAPPEKKAWGTRLI
jgi:hypothetical protein